MKLNKLGNSELFVSPYYLGTMTFGETTEQEDAHQQINEALEYGINFIDTAEMYPTCPIKKETTGKTEEIIGNWISKNKKTIKLAIEGSLKKLKTNYIDLYQLHWPNRGSYHFRAYWNYNPIKQDDEEITEEVFSIVETLYSLKKEGLIREFGLSNETCWGTSKYLAEVKKFKGLNIASIQNEYSLLCRLFDNDFNELSLNENIPLLAYSPLARGLLTGKYMGKKIPEGSRLSRDDKIRRIVNENSDLAVRAYFDLAQEHNLEPIHMALSFCRERPFMGSVIFGATNIVQLREILKGIDVRLTDETKNDIQKIYKKYPLTF